MATRAKPGRKGAGRNKDEITTAKMYRSELRALAIIADAHDVSQPEALRRFFGAALAAQAQAALKKQAAALDGK